MQQTGLSNTHITCARNEVSYGPVKKNHEQGHRIQYIRTDDDIFENIRVAVGVFGHLDEQREDSADFDLRLPDFQWTSGLRTWIFVPKAAVDSQKEFLEEIFFVKADTR